MGAARITIVSGCPGTGKTTVAAKLAALSPRGVQLDSDVFYRFFSHPILPIRAEAHEQNAAAIRAIAAAAGALSMSGYEVVVDGVLGPWFIPAFLATVDSLDVDVDYVVLRAPLGDTLERARSRSKTGPDDEAIVRHMHREFSDLGAFERHAVDTGHHEPSDTLEFVVQGRSAGRFLLGRPSAGSCKGRIR